MRVVFRCPPELQGLIPEPVMGRRGLPDWLRRMPAHVQSDELGLDIETVKQCPPFVDAMSGGFLMPLAADVAVEDGQLSWQWKLPVSPTLAYPRAPVSFHVPDQLQGSPLFENDAFAVKFTNYWAIALPAGIGLLCTHPANRLDLPFRTVTGLVHADTYENFIHFPALWSDPNFSGVLPRGTPVAQCYPVPLEHVEMELATIDGDAETRFREARSAVRDGAGAFRRHHRAS